MLSKETVDVKGVKVRPLDIVAAMLVPPVRFADKVKGHTCFVAEVTGMKNGKRSLAKMWTMMSHEEAYRLCRTNAGAYLVGTGGAVATEMLIDGEVKDKGIVIPEQLSPESFLRRLPDKHVKVHEQVVPLKDGT
jgi:saccharopine dehydrogenase-like NADP-dependent oxidoreductase